MNVTCAAYSISYPSISTGPHGRLASSMKNLFSAMDSNEEPLPPAMLLEGLQTIAPQFAERDQRGIPAQQGRLF